MADARNKIRFIIAGIAACLTVVSCSETGRPPYIQAQVVDVYNRKTDIYNAHFIYWWQERGETAFLDTHELASRELMAETAHSAAGSDGTLPVRIPLAEIARIDWVLAGDGKKMVVRLTNGQFIEARSVMPRELRVDPQAGIADFTCFISGSTRAVSGPFDFRQEFDFLRSVTISGIDTAR